LASPDSSAACSATRVDVPCSQPKLPKAGASGTTATDPNGNATTYYYTSGLNTSVKDAASHTSYFGYDVNYCRNAVTDARGYTWNYSYDSNGNVIDSEDPYGDITPQYYFIDNKPLFVIYPTGEATIFSYDGGENLTAVYHMSQGTWTSPPTMGGQGTGYNWGSVMAIENYTNNAYGERTDYYDANSHHYQYGYDNNGDLASVTTPLGHETQWTYDALGFCTSREDAMSRTTNYTPDGWERLTTITYPDTSTHSFVYDADGNLTQMTDGTGTTTRTYDNADRILTEAVGGTTHVTYNWDQTGQKGLLGNIVTADGRTITYTYTARNQLYTVSDSFGTTTYSYDADGNEVGIAKPDTETVTKVYDHMSRLSSTTDQTNGSVTLASFAYQYDADSRVQQMTEADGSKVVYGYDWGGRLTSEVRTGTSPYSISYTPDVVGNRVSETNGAATTALNYDNDDELTSTTSSTGGFVNSYSYDLNGEQTGRTLAGTAYTLAYDYDGQLTQISGGPSASQFAYDALGRRVSRTNGGTTTSFLFDGGAVVAQNSGGAYQMPTTFGNDPIRSGSELPIYDAQGNQRAITASNQTVTGTQIFDAFGNKVAATGSTASALQWQGANLYRTYSPDAGLLQAGARYYDPQVGRFTTRDIVLSQHPYIYCGGDPVNFCDPGGRIRLPRWAQAALVGFGLGGATIPPDPGSVVPNSGEETPIVRIQPGPRSGNGGGGGGNGNGGDGDDTTDKIMFGVCVIGVAALLTIVVVGTGGSAAPVVIGAVAAL
jgi:RHS repeat-associated protein